MLFRTRDFLLFLLTTAFLVIGIASTIGIDLSVARQKASLISFGENSGEEVIYQAFLSETPPDTRVSRISELKDKVATFLSLNKIIVVEPEEIVVEEDGVEVTEEGTILTCQNYQKSNVFWSPNDLKFEIAEGARIVYRYVPPDVAVDVSTSTEIVNDFQMRDVVLQLSLRTSPSGKKNCLNTDVVGIALDGSLIRNTEQSLYGVFGETTLIGYALDGFPIYGLSAKKADSCGGLVFEGEYRYYLSIDREGVLGCFSGEPTQIR
jgi:hypothetical protein